MSISDKRPGRDELVLIVEDDEGLRSLLLEEIRDAGFTAEATASAEEARTVIDEHGPDLVVSDIRLPGASGMDLLGHTRTLPSPPLFIIITAFGTIPQAVDALKAGAYDFLTKPLNLDHFVLAVNRALEARRLREQVQRYQQMLETDHFHGIIGRSPGMLTLNKQIVQIASGSGSVLITGESGVGKELVARAIHEESDRSARPFLAVNCAGVPKDLLESEFFGYEKGAFTGAAQSRKGLFAEADGGSLLLDEIAEMPLALQAKLLRVLQEGAVRPIGSSREKTVDVRLLAATNRNLEEEVQAGRFREDLFYRMETFQLRVPPLRERNGDLDLLAAFFLAKFSARLNKDIRSISTEAMRKLHEYPFPGNVRELENAIERAVTFCDSRQIEFRHLPERIREFEAPPTSSSDHEDTLALLLDQGSMLPTLARLEDRYIQYVLKKVGGNKRRAAALLGVGRRTLYRRLELSENPDSIK